MKTDRQVQRDVLDELNWEPSITAEHIGVEVSDGEVTLAGRVGSYAEKWNAEPVVQRVAGVRALAVALTVELPESGQRSDADIARSCERVVLAWLVNRTAGSVAATLVLHTAINFWPTVVPVLPTEASYRAYALVVAMLVLLACLALWTSGQTTGGRAVGTLLGFVEKGPWWVKHERPRVVAE